MVKIAVLTEKERLLRRTPRAKHHGNQEVSQVRSSEPIHFDCLVHGSTFCDSMINGLHTYIQRKLRQQPSLQHPPVTDVSAAIQLGTARKTIGKSVIVHLIGRL